MKHKSIAICMAVALTTVILLRLDSQRTLGSSTIEGTNLRCQIVQSRSIANIIGSGSTKIWFSVIDPQGMWIQTQRINIIGDGQTKWAQWIPPKSINPESRDKLTVIPIELGLPSGRTSKHNVVVGIK